MSSRHQKEKRLRPRNEPYKRDRFDQTRYTRVVYQNVEQKPKDPVVETVSAESFDETVDELES